jgi:hypothetical protein
VLVVVVFVGGVTVAVVNVVDVVAVLDGFVAAGVTVGVIGNRVLGRGVVLVVVVAVQRVAMSAMQVVDVVAVLDGFVAAGVAVGVVGEGVFGVEISHGRVLRALAVNG